MCLPQCTKFHPNLSMTSSSLTESISPDTCSPHPITQTVASKSSYMKDITQRHPRHPLIYPKKRPSPHGITKLHRSPVLPFCGPARRSPRSAKASLIQQRQREAQILALRREGILLEEEYREEIRYYMHDMEVSLSRNVFRALHRISICHIALYDVFRAINGPATRDKMAHETMFS